MAADDSVTPRELLARLFRHAVGDLDLDARLAPHQKSAVSAIVSALRFRTGILLADEAGLGKSWIAASVAREFFRRGELVELIVPASLKAMWRELLREFHISAEVLSHEVLDRQRFVPGALPNGLIVVDEAHRFRNPRTRRYTALALRSIGRRLLLVTATPICNAPEDLRALLSLMLADDALRDDGIASWARSFELREPEGLQEILRGVMVRRDRSALVTTLRFPGLRVRSIRYSIGALARPLSQLIEQLRFPRIVSRSGRPLLRQFLWYRMISSPAALVDSLRRQRRFYRRAREALMRGLTLNKHDYRRVFGDPDEGLYSQDLLFPQLLLAPDPSGANAAEIDDELALLDRMLALLQPSKDPKIERLLDLLAESFVPTLIFTGSTATARSLEKALRSEGRVGLASSRESRIEGARVRSALEAVEAFRDSRIDLLVSTDLGAEGLNLQAAGRVVHYDLPWSPVRLDQRNGRSRRIGQRRSSIEAIVFVCEEPAGSRVLSVIHAKSNLVSRLLEIQPPAPLAGMDEDVALRVSQKDCPSIARGCFHVSTGDGAFFLMEGRSGRSRWMDQPIGRTPELLDEGEVESCGDQPCRPASKRLDRIRRGRASLHCLPSRLPSSLPQSSLVERLTRLNLLDVQLFRLLTRRHRAGVEILIRQLSAEFLDRDRVEHLRSVLVREAALTQDGCELEGHASLLGGSPPRGSL